MISGATKKKRQIWWLGGTLAVLVALVVWSALRRSPEEVVVADFTASVVARDGTRLSATDRAQLRQQWERFSPETRKLVLVGVARHELDRFRAEAATLTATERSQRVLQELERIRQHRRQVTEAQKTQIREQLTSAQGQEMVHTVMTFYQTELTARERAELDPLAQAWMAQAEELFRGTGSQ